MATLSGETLARAKIPRFWQMYWGVMGMVDVARLVPRMSRGDGGLLVADLEALSLAGQASTR